MPFASRICLVVFFLAGCQQIHIPEGDVEAGRDAFLELDCHACHRVRGEDFPAPVASPPLPFVLGARGEGKSRAYLAESIIAPSHRFARPPRQYVATEPPMLISEAEYENVREGDKSRMWDYRETMTVRQMLDLVAFLESKYSPGRED